MGIRTRATRQPDGSWRLDGAKQFITNAAFADLFTIYAKIDGEAFSAFLVERETPGLSVGAEEEKMGLHGASTCPLTLDGVVVPDGNLLGEPGKGHRVAFNVLNVGRFKLAAACLGGMRPALGIATRYVAERSAFGRRLADFPLIGAKLAAIAARTYAVESTVYRIAGLLEGSLAAAADANSPDAVRAALEESGARVEDLWDRWAILALQGPRSVEVMERSWPGSGAPELKLHRWRPLEDLGRDGFVARTGYTGERGFELYVAADRARAVWERLLDLNVTPVGLGARDTLRLEMGYPLYGQDLFEASTALEAGLGWAVAMDKGEFRGRPALVRQQEEGLPSRLRGIRMHERRHIPRAHYPVFVGDQLVGEVTSGTFSPLLGTGIGLAYVWPGDVVDVGQEVEVDIRGRRGAATIVKPPFVDRSPR
jgi:alkylation response protein AidB-like acyl-CoA dehydrogenase